MSQTILSRKMAASAGDMDDGEVADRGLSCDMNGGRVGRNETKGDTSRTTHGGAANGVIDDCC